MKAWFDGYVVEDCREVSDSEKESGKVWFADLEGWKNLIVMVVRLRLAGAMNEDFNFTRVNTVAHASVHNLAFLPLPFFFLLSSPLDITQVSVIDPSTIIEQYTDNLNTSKACTTHITNCKLNVSHGTLHRLS